MKFKPQLFPSPINLPERTVGHVQIRHQILPKGHLVPIIGMRQALLRGMAPMSHMLTAPLRIHQLREKEGEHWSMWMSDLPEELNQIEELIHTIKPEGDVLIGGLGLGILTARVASLRDVMRIVIVEKSQDVIRLCRAPLKETVGRQEYVCSDIRKYLETTDEKFDYYLLDTWTGTNEGTWWEEVMPLRRIIRRRRGLSPAIHCWAEDIMWGQIYRCLTNYTVPHWYYSYLPVPMKEGEAEAFLNTVGTPWWEKQYGGAVDRYIYEVEYSRKRRARETANHPRA